MIGSFALVGATAAFAADATVDTSPLATSTQTAAPAAAPTQQLTASTDDSTSSPANVAEVVVTGSRIPQPNLKSVSPIQAVSQQEFQLTGTTDAIDLLNTLPQNFQNSKADFSNTPNPLTVAGGVSTADLRGLGPQRTLVLVNGRRLGIGDPNTADPNPAPDLDQIPVALIDHVEVLTGGASATYGSDAVAGVVNFIMKKDFEGVQLDAQYGADEHDNHETAIQSAEHAAGINPATGSKWDGNSSMLSLVIGANAPDNKGNVTGYFEFRNQDPVTEGDRDYSGCFLTLGAPDNCTAGESSNSNRFQEINDGINSHNGSRFTVIGNNFQPFGTTGGSPPLFFNSSPYEYLQRQDTRYLGGFFAHYEVNSWLQPYMEVSFMNDTSSEQIAPSGLFTTGVPGLGGYYVNCGNPFLGGNVAGSEALQLGCTPAEIASPNQVGAANGNQKLLVIGRRNIEGGGRTSSYDHMNYRIVGGAKGDIGDTGFHYDAYGSYYYTSLFQANGNYLSINGIQNALIVGGTAANPVCLQGNSCVPYNIFNQGGVTQAAEQSLLEPGTDHGTIEEAIWEADVTGDLGKWGIKSPWASDPVAVSVGMQHRWDHEIFAPDQAELSGDLSGAGGASVSVNNAIGVMEEYFETRIPIVQKMPFIDDLNISGGFRNSDYSTSGSVQTYKIGGEWAPTADVTFRASYDRAIRAASILEAFTPQTVTLTSALGLTGDPCAPITNSSGVIIGAAPATLAQCEHTGVTAAEYGNGGTTNTIQQCVSSQCGLLTGGNPHLTPEIADTYSIGATFTPSFLHGFTGSIDYFNITINGEIGTANLLGVFDACLDNNIGCNNVVRTSNGFLTGSTKAGGGYIVGLNANVGEDKESGVDFQFSYRHPIPAMMGHDDLGSLGFNFYATYLISRGLPGQDCAGLFGPECQTVNPQWRHTFQMTWNTPWNWLARLQWRYISGTTLDENSTQPGLTAGPGNFDPFDNSMPAVSYLDLSAAWRVTSNLTVRGGINNILDTDPPIISQGLVGTGSPNAYPTYDLLGRVMFLSATVKF